MLQLNFEINSAEFFLKLKIVDAEVSKETVLKDQKQDLETELLKLKEFDLDSEYGPCIGR